MNTNYVLTPEQTLNILGNYYVEMGGIKSPTVKPVFKNKGYDERRESLGTTVDFEISGIVNVGGADVVKKLAVSESEAKSVITGSLSTDNQTMDSCQFITKVDYQGDGRDRYEVYSLGLCLVGMQSSNTLGSK